MVPLRVSAPRGYFGAVLLALLDTGADCTLVPRSTARALRLPAVYQIWLEGIAGGRRRATVFDAQVEFGGFARLATVVAFGEHAILGRDLANHVLARLDGPRRRLSLQAPLR